MNTSGTEPKRKGRRGKYPSQIAADRRYYKKKYLEGLKKDLDRNYCRFHKKNCPYKNAWTCYLMRQKQNKGAALKHEIGPPKHFVLGVNRKKL